MENSTETTPARDDTGLESIQRLEQMGELDMESMELFTRLLIGFAAEGEVLILDRLRVYQEQIDELVALESLEASLDEASRTELIRYLTVGALVRAQRGSVRKIYETAALATNTTRTAFGLLDRVTDNFVGRPFRRPAESFASRFREEIGESVVVGYQEMSEGRVLARTTTIDFIDDFIAYISGSPELADLVSDQIGQQSLSVAGTVAEGGRTVTLGADNAIEGLIRRILRRPARDELPKSPFVGNPEAVFHPGPSLSLAEEETPSTSSGSEEAGKDPGHGRGQ